MSSQRQKDVRKFASLVRIFSRLNDTSDPSIGIYCLRQAGQRGQIYIIGIRYRARVDKGGSSSVVRKKNGRFCLEEFCVKSVSAGNFYRKSANRQKTHNRRVFMSCSNISNNNKLLYKWENERNNKFRRSSKKQCVRSICVSMTQFSFVKNYTLAFIMKIIAICVLCFTTSSNHI